MRTTWLGLVGDGFSGRRNYDKSADEHLPADRVGTSVDKYGKVSSIGFPWRPIVAILNIQLPAQSSVSLRSGGSILLSKAGPFLASGEVIENIHVYFELETFAYNQFTTLPKSLHKVLGLCKTQNASKGVLYAALSRDLSQLGRRGMKFVRIGSCELVARSAVV